MEIKIRALPLLAISDHISRKSPYRLGALVGVRHVDMATVTDAFDLKHTSESIDLKFLQNKLSLIQTINSKSEFLGLYSCDENNETPSHLGRQLAQSGFSGPLLYMAPMAEGSFVYFSLESGKPLHHTLTPSESEAIAILTVQNNAHYTQKDSNLIQESDTHVGSSFQQLKNHVEHILTCGSLDQQTEKQMVHLAQVVSNYKGLTVTENYELHAAYLSLLSSQIATIKCANAQLDIHTAAVDKRGYRRVAESRGE